MSNNEIEKLANEYFIEELGFKDDEVNEASQNLLGYFRTLHQIQDRLEKKGVQL